MTVTRPYTPIIGYDYYVLHIPKKKEGKGLSHALNSRSCLAFSGILLGTRRMHAMANAVVRHKIWLDYLGKMAEVSRKIFDRLEAPLQGITHLALGIRLVFSPVRFVHKAKKIVHSHGWKLFDHSMAALNAMRIFSVSLAILFKSNEQYQWTTWAPILRVAAIVATPLAVVGAVLSLARLTIHARHCWKVYQFTREFDRLAALQGEKIKYENLHHFLINTKHTLLRRAFKIESKHLRAQLPLSMESHFESMRMEDLVPLLRGRLTTTLRHQALVILADAIYTVGAALLVTNVLASVGELCKGIFGFWLFGSGCYQMWSSHHFHHQLKIA